MLRKILLFVALVVLIPAVSFGVNPQAPGPPEFVQGGVSGIAVFGPFAIRELAPTSISTWSTDGQSYRLQNFIPGYTGSDGEFESNSWKVRESFMDAAPAAKDTMGGWYVFLKVHAQSVAATDSVVVKPYFGGVNK